MDIKVQQTQQWLNDTYSGVISIDEDGITGWSTIRALITALQIELGVVADGILGDATLAAFLPLSVESNPEMLTINHQIHILQGALYCKGQGLDPIYLNGVYSESTKAAVAKLQSYAGLTAVEQTGIADAEVMRALLNMDAYTLLAKGDANIRTIQQSLNSRYHSYTGLIPCDGIFSKRTQRALISGLQVEEKKEYSNNVVDGVWGPTTMNRCPTLMQYGTIANRQYVYLLQFALYANGFDPNGFDGGFGNGVKLAATRFQGFVGLTADGIVGKQTWASLMVSYGDQSRRGTACDFMRPLNAQQAQTLVADGRKVVGRYIVGGANKKLTLAEMQILYDAGLSIFPIYQTANNYREYFSEVSGRRDATYAFNALRSLKFPNQTIVYFAVDFDATIDDVNNYILPYFQAIKKSFDEFGANKYRIGIYGPRFVCTIVQKAGFSVSSFVCDMSSGFSCNIGYPLPADWAFDQISTITIGNNGGIIEIDNNISSGRDLGVLIDPRTAANPGAGDESEERIADLETISRICASQNLPKDFFSVNHVFGVEYLIFSAPGLSVYLSAKNNVSTGTGPLSITSVVSNGELKNPTVSAAVSEVITANFTDFEKFCPNFSSLALSISEGGLSISVTQDFANKKFIVSVTAMIFEVETDSTDFPATAKLSVTLKYVFDMDSQTSPPNYATAKDWFSAIDWEQAREAVAIAAVCILVAIAFGYASIPIITMIMQAFPA